MFGHFCKSCSFSLDTAAFTLDLSIKQELKLIASGHKKISICPQFGLQGQ